MCNQSRTGDESTYTFSSTRYPAAGMSEIDPFRLSRGGLQRCLIPLKFFLGTIQTRLRVRVRAVDPRRACLVNRIQSRGRGAHPRTRKGGFWDAPARCWNISTAKAKRH